MMAKTLRQLKESAQARVCLTEITDEVHDQIMAHMNKKPGRHSIKIQKPSTHVHTNYKSEKRYTVYPVHYKTAAHDDKHVGYATYYHHEEGTNNVKPGLPPRFGGDIRRVY
jgi:hypothetical protein